MTLQHSLYRFFDSNDALLYVGRTINPGSRWRDHERKKPWFTDVASMTRTVYPTAEAVDMAERQAIATEGPRHNIAHNPNAFRLAPAPAPIDPEEADVADRWAIVGYKEAPCEGDETVCECRACHKRRYVELDNLHAMYDFHPEIEAQIQRIERMYYGGHWLSDWYYDFTDVAIFAPVRLHVESAKRPLPAHVDLDGQVASVFCPICGNEHRHLLPQGALLDDPLTAPCSKSDTSGRYVLYTDWSAAHDALFAWGDRLVRAA